MRHPIEDLLRDGALGRLDDPQLLEIFLGGSEAAEGAFRALVERHGPMVLRACRGELRDPAAADDAFQNTFLVLVRRAHSVRKRASVGSWLFGVAIRVARRSRRGAARRLAREREAAARASRREAESVEGQPGVESELLEEIERLPEAYRLPVVLCYLEGLSTEEVARRLGCPKGTILSRLSRARDRLKVSLARRGLAPAIFLEPGLRTFRDFVAGSLVEATVGATMRTLSGGAAIGGTTAAGLLRRIPSRAAGAAAIIGIAGLSLAALVSAQHDARWLEVVRSTGKPSANDAGRPVLEVVAPPEGVHTMHPAALALQPDGKVIVASNIGTSFECSKRVLLLRRLPDGTLDQTFGKGGFVESNLELFGSWSPEWPGPKVVVQPDGKIVLGATTVATGSRNDDLAFERFQTDGTTDPSFGGGRPVLIDVRPEYSENGRFPNYDELRGLALLSDGKILAGGWTSGPPRIGDAFALVRLLPDGTPDESFGDRGRVAAPFLLRYDRMGRPVSKCHSKAMAVSANGRIILAGTYISATRGGDIALTVYDTRGFRDPTFGDGGCLTIDLGSEMGWGCYTNDEAHAVAFTPEGSILVAGCTLGVASESRVALIRLGPSGRLDPNFGSGGLSMAGTAVQGRGTVIALQDGGKILVGGRSCRTYSPLPNSENPHNDLGDFLLARFLGDGTLDSRFGERGVTKTVLRGENQVEGLASLAGGSIIAVGHDVMRNPNDFRSDLILLRYPSR